MITPLDTITLKSGESVQAAVITAPEPMWAERILELLSHKGDPWNWQNATVLERKLGLDAYFYILHRDGQPFANIMTVERDGVGIFGHVWTKPEDRQQGASKALLTMQMADFQQRNGRALYLITGNPVAHRLYEQFGFRDVAPDVELMAYTADSLAQFEADYFGNDQPLATSIQPLDWHHWPAACPLFFGGSPGIVRSASLGMIGRSTPEDAFLPLLLQAERKPGPHPQAMVLALETGAVAGLAVWGRHPIWPDTCIVDIYCHHHYWHRGGDLLDSLTLPPAERYVAYGEAACPQKNELLSKAGFVQEATLPQWFPSQSTSNSSDDLFIFTRKV